MHIYSKHRKRFDSTQILFPALFEIVICVGNITYGIGNLFRIGMWNCLYFFITTLDIEENRSITNLEYVFDLCWVPNKSDFDFSFCLKTDDSQWRGPSSFYLIDFLTIWQWSGLNINLFETYLLKFNPKPRISYHKHLDQYLTIYRTAVVFYIIVFVQEISELRNFL